ncbi:MAG: hypothetical protein ACREDO_12020 [Methyloceanibacter sp.]
MDGREGQPRQCARDRRFYHSEIESLASATARIGYAWDRLLAYVKVGGAWQREPAIRGRVHIELDDVGAGVESRLHRAAGIIVGWTIDPVYRAGGIVEPVAAIGLVDTAMSDELDLRILWWRRAPGRIGAFKT